MSIGKKLILIGENPTKWVMLSAINNRVFISIYLSTNESEMGHDNQRMGIQENWAIRTNKQ